MFCVKCGKELEDGYTFCPACGTPLQNTATPAARQQSDNITISKHFLKKWIPIVIAAILLICIGIAVFVAFSSKEAAEAPPATAKAAVQKTVEVVGKWQEKNTPSVYMTLNKDHTGEMSSGGWAIKLNWTYSESTHTVTLNVSGMNAMTATYNPKDDTISQNGVIFVRVS